MASSFQWNPEDDHLLKTCLEAGASLESLAKGVVQFSRQFTVQELHDRWYSLLYDPFVSEQAAAHMIRFDNFELTNPSKSNKPGSIKGIAGNSEKRKAESVQSCYYSMRKRICSEPVLIEAANPLSEPGYINSGIGVREEPQCMDFGIGDPSYALDHITTLNELTDVNFHENENFRNEHGYSEYGGTSLHLIGHSSLIEQNPIIRNVRDNTDYNPLSEFGEEEQPREDPIVPSPLSVSDFVAELFDDELPVDDFEGKEMFERSYAGYSLLLGSANDIEGSAGPDHFESVEVPASLPDIEAMGPPDHYDYVEVPSSLLDTEAMGPLDPYDSVEVPSSLLDTEAMGPEYKNGVICCTLNTEDLEIPSNDDVFLPYRLNEPSYLVPSSVKNYSSAQWGGENNNHVHSPDRGLSPQLNVSRDLKTAERKVRFILPDSNTQFETPGITKESRCAVGQNADNEDSNELFGKAVMARGETLVTVSSDAESREQGIVVNNNVNEAVPLDQPKFEPEPENVFDVPDSVDVEAMILDMGLSPDEFDLYTHPEVQKYRHEETKRIIIRLEQATDACMQRAMEAKGAFAVLHSRYFKHFIMKPEVLLGRATEDAAVDIDLGKVKNGCKISRRQAFMVMGSNGSFHMKNLGKYPIFVNGKEVASNQSTSLQSGCLIEIRGLSFVFEMNHAEAKRYMDHMNTNIFLQQEVR